VFEFATEVKGSKGSDQNVLHNNSPRSFGSLDLTDGLDDPTRQAANRSESDRGESRSDLAMSVGRMHDASDQVIHH
jgi:hypothetical protein